MLVLVPYVPTSGDGTLIGIYMTALSVHYIRSPVPGNVSRIVPRNGIIVINGDDDNLRALGPMSWTRVVRVGVGEGNDLRIVDFAQTPAGAEFKLLGTNEINEMCWSSPSISKGCLFLRSVDALYCIK